MVRFFLFFVDILCLLFKLIFLVPVRHNLEVYQRLVSRIEKVKREDGEDKDFNAESPDYVRSNGWHAIHKHVPAHKNFFLNWNLAMWYK